MSADDDPFASFAAPREQLSPVEIWKRQRIDESRQWRRLRSVGGWLLGGTLLGSMGAAVATGDLATGGPLLGGAVMGMPVGLAAGWLLGFGSWGGRFLRGTRLVPTSEMPVPMLWLAICSGVGLITGAAVGSWALPFLLMNQGAADRTAAFGPAGVGAGAGLALIVVYLRRARQNTGDGRSPGS